jgi:hypothetical protein
MAFTANDIMTMAQRFLVDIEDDAYRDTSTNEPMLSYLNEAQRRFATETFCCQSIADLASVTSKFIPYTTLAAAISDALDIVYVFKVEVPESTLSQFLPKAPISEMKDTLAVSVLMPTRYTVFGEQIVLDTHESATLALSNVNVYCAFIPNDIDATDNILIPDEWAQALVHYIVYCCRVTDRDAGMANGAFAEYEAMRLHAASIYKVLLEK